MDKSNDTKRSGGKRVTVWFGDFFVVVLGVFFVLVLLGFLVVGFWLGFF